MPNSVLSKNGIPKSLHEKLSTHWENWLQACEKQNLSSDPGVDLSLLGKIWACSDFIATSCCRNPDLWFELIQDDGLNRSMAFDDYQSALATKLAAVATTTDSAIYDHALMKSLRLFRQQQMMRIAWRDLAGLAATTETLRNLTDLAESCVDQTLECLYQDLCQHRGTPSNANGDELRLIVLGMGKLGGHELNFSSDIDLIFAFEEEGETRSESSTRRAMANSQFFTQLGQRFIKALNDVTADGFVFRVDMRLRPYGDSGPLVMSFAGMEHYYQTQGRDWERYAMIKARVIGGDRKAGAELMAMLKPFVYRRYLDFGAFEAIRDMKAMIAAEIKRKGNENNIKLGAGGIREIEFIGQTFQLIRGGGDAELQVRSILQVLALLANKGYMSEQASAELADSYDFLRRLENRLQMYADGQTHNLPDDELIQQSMVLAMDAESWPALLAATAAHRQRVHNHFIQVFAVPQFSEDENATGNALASVWRDPLDEGHALEIIEQENISDAEEVYRQLISFKQAAQIKALQGASRQRLDKLMPLLLAELVGQEHAGIVIQRLLNLLLAVVRRSVYLALLIEYPIALTQLVTLCAASPWIAHLVTRYPILLDELLDPRAMYEIPNSGELKRELDAQMEQAVDDEELQMEILRKFKQAQVLKVATMDVAAGMQVFDVSDHLTQIGEVLVQKAMELAWQHMSQRHGKPQCIIDGEEYEPSMAIVAYGKMGGHELGYSSDLDIVFLHDSRGENQLTDGQRSLDNPVFFARVAQRVIHILGTQTANGRLYEVDMRLRPDGASGMLVSSLAAFEKYQQEKAWTWEHQALIRARVVYGNTHLAEEFDRIRRSVLCRDRDLPTLQNDVIEMRQKMRESLGSKTAEVFHLKQDAGGIVDIEFITQFKVLAAASRHPELLDETATRQLLQALYESGEIEAAQLRHLSEAYQMYRARLHQRALQEQSSSLDGSEFQPQREYVKQIWHNLLENPGS
ncbi:MAG: bifunctional [glutamate--ammonia ligase]-adenylyl-L-tyrosine phosphorylase/[glutamate--ammonia-ligase] adenylyltransferase [Gammaproteobacteria bacterium]|nr:bifunctional [glutamate--ammonia ligase]-adenylyl-L-tyrosine phosphorylase/[glutamate--ammonia-ligase] adenylyltransferase [Gammaproteobacteria bacterium]